MTKPRLKDANGDECTRSRIGRLADDHEWCQDCYPGVTYGPGTLEAMKAAEGDDPMLIAARVMRYPNSGNTIVARKLAKAVLDPSQKRLGMDVKFIDGTVYILVFGGQLTEGTIERLERFAKREEKQVVLLLEAEAY